MMNIENQKFEEWRNEQINSLVRMGYPDAAKAFRDLGTIHWAGWQAAWKASRESVMIELHKEFENDTDKPFGELLTIIANTIRDHCKSAIEAAGLKVKS